ncbi:MAG: hypothetical protein K6G76_00810 [Lachnospiraceae bacterium]|jgi:hypothetical protein|nr:hypothetical protein [Lachnospiraceae bacterium]
MACFLVPTGEAIVTTVLTKAFKAKEKAEIEPSNEEISEKVSSKIPFSKKLTWLNNMLWGGSALLAFEHVWHGEVVPWFPFLTAMEDPNEATAMLHEMSTVGVSMAVLVTVVWGIMALASDIIMKGESFKKIKQ